MQCPICRELSKRRSVGIYDDFVCKCGLSPTIMKVKRPILSQEEATQCQENRRIAIFLGSIYK